MLYRNNGIIARGLGGGPSSLILGNWSVGSTSIEVTVVRGGGGGSHIPPLNPYNQDPTFDLVMIKVTHKGKVWKHEYSVMRKLTPVVIHIVSILNKVNASLSVTVKNIRRLINKIRIK